MMERRGKRGCYKQIVMICREARICESLTARETRFHFFFIRPETDLQSLINPSKIEISFLCFASHSEMIIIGNPKFTFRRFKPTTGKAGVVGIELCTENPSQIFNLK